MKTPTLYQFKAFARDHAELAYAVAMAQAFAQVERERVSAYIQPLFELYDFYVCDQFAERIGRERITDPDRLYLTDLESPQYLDFVEQCDVEHRKHGFTGPKGHCPALVADELRRVAERTLIGEGCRFMGIEPDALWRNMGAHSKMLDLLMGACLKARVERKAAYEFIATLG